MRKVCLQAFLLCRPSPTLMPPKSTASSQMPYRLGTGLQSHPAQHKGIWAKCPERLLHCLTSLGEGRACKDPGTGLPELPRFATTQLYQDPEGGGRADHRGEPCHASPVTPVTPRHITEPQEIKYHAPTTLSEETFAPPSPRESHRQGDCSVHQTTSWAWHCLAPGLCLKEAVGPISHFFWIVSGDVSHWEEV